MLPRLLHGLLRCGLFPKSCHLPSFGLTADGSCGLLLVCHGLGKKWASIVGMFVLQVMDLHLVCMFVLQVVDLHLVCIGPHWQINIFWHWPCLGNFKFSKYLILEIRQYCWNCSLTSCHAHWGCCPLSPRLPSPYATDSLHNSVIFLQNPFNIITALILPCPPCISYPLIWLFLSHSK